MALRAKLFGTPTVMMDQVRLTFPLRKTEGLFYYLLLNKSATRDQIASMFWPDRDEVAAGNNLRNSIYMLRKLFTHDVILSDKRLLELNPEVVVDSDFAHIGDVADLSFAEPQLYAQEFMEGFEILESELFTAWLREMRRKVRESFLEGLRDRIQRCYDTEDRPELLRSLSLMVSCDISDEDYVLELMELHASANRLPKALQIFRDYEKRLRNELGIAPDKRAQEFFARMTAMAPVAPEAGHEQDIGDFFFGREPELLDIARFLTGTNDRRGLCINIYGEAGVGKSTLARHLLRKTELASGVAFTAKGYEIGNKYFFSPWYDVVRELNARYDLSALDMDPIKLSLLSATFPGTFEKRLLTANYGITSVFRDASPILLGHILVEIFRKLQCDGDIVLLLEDIQWFDELSMHLLIAFLERADNAVTVITTSRSKSGRNMRNMIENLSLRGETKLLSIELEPFSLEESAGFLASVLDRSHFESLDVKIVYSQTYGLPLFLAEVASSIRNGEGLQNLQDRINNILAWRYSDVTPEQREILEMASIFPSGVRFDDLAAILEMDRLALSRLLEQVTSRGILQTTEEEAGTIRLQFRHSRLRDFFYENIPLVRRREMHRLPAGRLEKLYEPEVWDPSLSATLCYHFNRAGMPEKELDFILREMRMHVMLNHELFPPLDDEQLIRTAGVLSGKAETLSRLNESRKLLFNLDRKRTAPREYLKMEATVLELQGGYMIGWGQYTEGLQAIRRSLELAIANSFKRIHLNCLKHTCYHGVQIENAVVLEKQGQELLFVAREYNDEVSQGMALRFLGVAMQLSGDMDQAEKTLLESVDVFKKIGNSGRSHTLGVLAAWNYIGEIYHWRNELDRALKTFEYCIESCRKTGISWGLSLFYSKAGNVAFDMGLMDTAQSYATRSIELFEQGEGGRSGSIAYSLRAIFDAQKGQYTRALQAMQRSENLCVGIDKRSWMAVHYTAAYRIKSLLEKSPVIRNALSDYLSDPSFVYAEKALRICRDLRIIPGIRLLQSS